MQQNQNDAAQDITLNNARQTLIHVIQDQFASRDINELRNILETQYGEPLWDSEQLLALFEVSHFEPPYVHVIRKSDGVAGTVAFNDAPRFYFSFKPKEAKNVRGTT